MHLRGKYRQMLLKNSIDLLLKLQEKLMKLLVTMRWTDIRLLLWVGRMAGSQTEVKCPYTFKKNEDSNPQKPTKHRAGKYLNSWAYNTKYYFMQWENANCKIYYYYRSLLLALVSNYFRNIATLRATVSHSLVSYWPNCCWADFKTLVLTFRVLVDKHQLTSVNFYTHTSPHQGS